MKQEDSHELQPAIFLDRDGVLNKKLPENCYLSDICDFEFIEGSARALKKLKSLGYVLLVVTNQRGIARQLMTVRDLERVHDHMLAELKKLDAELDGIYFCPHDNNEACPCRKPEPGMILKAAQAHNISLVDSYLVGDRASDIEAGKRAGVKTVLVGRDQWADPDFTFPSLLAFAQALSDQKIP